jgi:hypothetical protein
MTENLSDEEVKWLQILYQEAWKQYSHEDNISQSRNNLFMGIQAALVTILVGVTPFLIGMTPIAVGNKEIPIGIPVLGFILILFSFFATRLTLYWKGVTKAGNAYLNLRWITIRAIEHRVGLSGINLAEIEHKWRQFIRVNPDKNYHPFVESEDLNEHYVAPRGEVGGWDSILRVIDLVKAIWRFLGVMGILLIVLTALYVLLLA